MKKKFSFFRLLICNFVLFGCDYNQKNVEYLDGGFSKFYKYFIIDLDLNDFESAKKRFAPAVIETTNDLDLKINKCIDLISGGSLLSNTGYPNSTPFKNYIYDYDGTLLYQERMYKDYCSLDIYGSDEELTYYVEGIERIECKDKYNEGLIYFEIQEIDFKYEEILNISIGDFS